MTASESERRLFGLAINLRHTWVRRGYRFVTFRDSSVSTFEWLERGFLEFFSHEIYFDGADNFRRHHQRPFGGPAVRV